MSSEDPAGEHLRVEHLKGDLKGRSVRGGALVLAGQGLKLVFQIGSTMVMARLLYPSDFGLVAMVTAITGFVALVKDLGLSLATVQRENITNDQVNASFWINVGVGVAMTALVAGLAPVLAGLYHEPRLVLVTVALSFGFLVSGVAVQHYALLQRQMRFGALAVVDVASVAVQVGVGIVLAVLGAGYWALVWMSLAGSFTNTLLLWFLCDWRPRLEFHGDNLRPLLSFGGYVSGFNAVNYWGRNLDNVLIGWRWGAGELGFYSKAYNLLMLPLNYVNGPASTVLMPASSRIQSDPTRFRRGYRQYLSTITSLTVPFLTVCVILSNEIILVMLGPRWNKAAHIFQVLAIAGVIQAVMNQCGPLMLAVGDARRYFRLAVMATAATVVAFLIGLRYGAIGVATAYAVYVWIAAIPIVSYAARYTPVQPLDFLKAVRKPLILASLVGIAVFGARAGLSNETEPALRLLVGMIVAVGLWLLLVNLPWYREDNPVRLFLSVILQKETSNSEPR